MDILKRWLKLKKAQRVRNPWAVASVLNQGKHTGNSGTSKGAYVAGINRNEWNSPEGMEAASERSAEYHGMSPKRKKGHKYSAAKKKNENKPLTAKQRAAEDKLRFGDNIDFEVNKSDVKKLQDFLRKRV